ncbi:winged helix-turn-helix domain-containing protein [uncultured Winogradskyella sp.]|uniref:winged helix-turn-helix domain-containing protein n=1 Tax=uncultured Winogradskyella sp. TaxID=395353 RepID=UPI0026309DAE|nr:winged helix-turn-helix domain-containing protein [uncultured Winogradskyella sp.]
MKYNYTIKFLVIICFAGLASCHTSKDNFPERTKIALRDVGNKLLLSQKDSTSLILPVKELHFNKFQLTFNNSLAIEPNTLVDLIDKSLKALKLPEQYIVEVIQCDSKEVAYSYQMTKVLESTIIPCNGRYLPESCYKIEVYFHKRIIPNSEAYFFIWVAIGVLLIFVLFFRYKKKLKLNTAEISVNYESIGSFKFYPEQNKLIKEAEEIALSKKECELLALFVERPNEVIKRDELTKKVWEDNGVFVGRSLDTYISKLRKKLKADTSIKLTNIHGVGYKLEIL